MLTVPACVVVGVSVGLCVGHTLSSAKTADQRCRLEQRGADLHGPRKHVLDRDTYGQCPIKVGAIDAAASGPFPK